ncbi:MAG: peptidase M23 [Acidobacteria bacterium]|nr:MAG: peptidase M23 [Acidobacteriota bacterium]
MTKRIDVLALVQLFVLSCAVAAQTAPAANDWKAVEQALGRSGQLQGDGAYKFGLPRGDLKVTVDGVQVKPTLALGSWVAFSSPGQDAMLMGDLVLAEDEVSPVMLALEENGLQITALHNHVLHETPRVMYMHIVGHGDAVKLAGSVRHVMALTKTPAPTQPPTTPPAFDLDTTAIDEVLGHKGKVNGGVYQVGVPRAEKITEAGMPVPGSMGLATALNFQPTGAGKAAVTGDFVLLGTEVNPVIRALRQNAIQVTAIHSHMLEEQPRLFFMHFWANDDAVKLAKGLRAALDNTNSAK